MSHKSLICEKCNKPMVTRSDSKQKVWFECLTCGFEKHY